MGHQNPDPESLQKSGGRRGNCLDRFLLVSVLLLFVVVSAVAAGGVLVLMELRSKVEAPPNLATLAAAETSTFKMQNFAFLEVISSELKNSTMSWAPVSFMAEKSVGSNFYYDEQQHSLKSNKEGFYFIYINLNVSCTYNRCSDGVLAVALDDKLTCQVQLPADRTFVSKQCWVVAKMDQDARLLGHMTVPKDGLENWRLELKGSNFGMFLVD